MNVHRVTAPILWQEILLYVAVETGVRPINDPRYKSVFDRIVVDVVDMPVKISIISDGVFPIAALPNSLFALFILLAERDLAAGRPREKSDLKRLQRDEKSASPLGKSHRT